MPEETDLRQPISEIVTGETDRESNPEPLATQAKSLPIILTLNFGPGTLLDHGQQSFEILLIYMSVRSYGPGKDV